MGHIGLTPQSVHQLGGFRPQGKTALTAADPTESSVFHAGATAYRGRLLALDAEIRASLAAIPEVVLVHVNEETTGSARGI